MNAIEVDCLTKRYAQVTAVDGVSFALSRGELFGFLGPNGAGKTTTINMLTGLARPDAGSIRIDGIDCSDNPKAGQHLIGVVPDESNLYPELTGFENLSLCAALYGMKKAPRTARAHELLSMFGLTDAANRKFGGYSRGMKRKLTIAAGIIHEPSILFLDEPTTGIDVASARQIRQLIADLHHNGTTIFLTTHYIEEAERLCDRIAFIVAGRIIRTDTVAALLQHTDGSHTVEFTFSNAARDICKPLTIDFPQLQCRPVSEGKVRVESREPINIGPVIRFFEERGIEVTEARKIQLSLEEVFVHVTGIEVAMMRKEKEKAGSGS